MDLDDKTPVVEEPKSFPNPAHRDTDCDGVMMAETSPDSEVPPSLGSSSSTASGTTVSASTSGPTTTSGSSVSMPGPSGAKAIPQRSTADDASGMSESYHEIFDTLMPPETAKAKVMAAESEAEDQDETSATSTSILPDGNTASATKYLTSKLVEDSIKWQQEHPKGSTPAPSPLASPAKRKPLPKVQTANGKMEVLDPHCILELERSAKHLATSVDEMSENLSGLLHGISSLTVDTMETYRDGVCKTCDAVDGNIKSMYQVMAKVEELNKSMAPAYKIAEDVKEVKRVLDLLENAFK